MKHEREEWEKRVRQYRKWLSKEPMLYGLSEQLYIGMLQEKAGQAEETQQRKMQHRKTQPRKTQQTEALSAIPAREVSAAVAGLVLAPVLCGYVLWVVQEAVNSGKKRLYFLARDGYQMYQMAKLLCSRLGLPLECRYLYCSRYALRTAEYAIRGEAALDYLCLDGIHVTWETVCHRAGIFNMGEIKQEAEVLQIENCRQRLSYTELRELRKKLGQYDSFKKKLTERGKKAYEAAIGYFAQEGMLEDIPYALVDSGWVGSIQQSFKHLLNHAGKAGEIEGYYFGLYEYPKGADQSAYHTYYFSPEHGLRRKAAFNNNLFECICTSPEGMAEGYVFCGGRYAPKLAGRRNPNAAKVEAHTSCFLRYAEQLGEQLKAQMPSKQRKEERASGKQQRLNAQLLSQKQRKNILKVSKRLLSMLMGQPTWYEAKEYGSYVFCDDVIGEENQTLAAALSKPEIKANRLLPQIVRKYIRADGTVRGSAWIEASAVLAYGDRKRAGSILWQCKMLQYMRCLKKQLKTWKC